MCKTKSWKLSQSFAEGLLQPGKNKQTKNKKPDRKQTKRLNSMSDHPHNQYFLAVLVLGIVTLADMWIKQYDTEVKRKSAKNSDYSCVALRHVSQPQVVNLFGSPCQKSPELHRIGK